MSGEPATAGPRRVALVVVAWNGREDVLRCLDSLRRETAAGDEVVVVDNGSSDGTADAVRRSHPDADILATGSNLGYAGGANAGLRRALERGFRWALLLNQDVTLEPGALGSLLSEGEARPGAAALQPLLLSAADPGRIDSLGIRVLRAVGARDDAAGEPASAAPGDVRPIFGACGAAVLLRCDALREAGLLDEGYFLLLEDVDLAFRLRAAGHEALLVPAARARHRRGISGGAADAAGARRRRFLLHRNLAALALRWWPAGALALRSPVVAAQMAQALALRGAAPGLPCVPLWRRSLAARGESRRRMREQDADVWFA